MSRHSSHVFEFLFIALAAVIVISAPRAARGDGAIVISEFDCFLPAEASGLPEDLLTTKSHTVVTPSGGVTLSCLFDIPDGYEPPTAIVIKGELCMTFLGPTDDSIGVGTPGGKIMISCHINGRNR